MPLKVDIDAPDTQTYSGAGVVVGVAVVGVAVVVGLGVVVAGVAVVTGGAVVAHSLGTLLRAKNNLPLTTLVWQPAPKPHGNLSI